jgi:hypothetical protein
MQYQKIHDALIERAKTRVLYDSKIHHKHHVIPVHEDSTSTETVILTHKEHRIVHFLRWKIARIPGNLLAYILLKGCVTHPNIASMAGRIGGKITKNNKLGIFSDSWDRSQETSRRWVDGIISREAQIQLMQEGLAKRAAAASILSAKGIHSKDWDHSEQNRLMWSSLTFDQKEQRVQSNRKNAKLGGEKSKELGTNFSTWDTEKQKKVCSLGGKSHLGKIWIYKGDIKTRVKQEDLQQYLMNGWLKGRGK